MGVSTKPCVPRRGFPLSPVAALKAPLTPRKRARMRWAAALFLRALVATVLCACVSFAARPRSVAVGLVLLFGAVVMIVEHAGVARDAEVDISAPVVATCSGKREPAYEAPRQTFGTSERLPFSGLRTPFFSLEAMTPVG